MATIEILKVGHALVAGVRGEKGGKPSKDSLYGVARIKHGNATSLFTFGGRRGAAVLRCKTYPKTELEAVLAKFDGKLVKAAGGFNYKDITADRLEILGSDFDSKLTANFVAEHKAGKINDRALAKKATAPTVAKVEAAPAATPAEAPAEAPVAEVAAAPVVDKVRKAMDARNARRRAARAKAKADKAAASA